MTFILFILSLSNGVSSTGPVVANTDKIDICNVQFLNEIAGVNADQFCINHDNMTRCWYLYIPDSVVTTSLMPLVLDLHRYNLFTLESTQYTGWNHYALEHGFIVAYP